MAHSYCSLLCTVGSVIYGQVVLMVDLGRDEASENVAVVPCHRYVLSGDDASGILRYDLLSTRPRKKLGTNRLITKNPNNRKSKETKMHARELKANRLCLCFLMMGVLVFAVEWAETIEHQLAEAASYLDQKQYQQAYTAYDHIFVNSPEDENAFTAGKGRVEASIGMNDYSGDQQAFDELRHRFPVHPELSQALLGIGHAHIRSRNHIQAISTFQCVIDDYPSANANVLAQATYSVGQKLP